MDHNTLINFCIADGILLISALVAWIIERRSEKKEQQKRQAQIRHYRLIKKG